MRIDIYSDAACDNRSKLKLMGAGVAVFIDGQYSHNYSTYHFIGAGGTSNIGEWEAMQLSLEVAFTLSGVFYPELKSIRIYGDSQLVVNQMNDVWRCKQGHLKPYYTECKTIAESVGEVLKCIAWIPREDNEKADELSRFAISEYLKTIEK